MTRFRFNSARKNILLLFRKYVIVVRLDLIPGLSWCSLDLSLYRYLMPLISYLWSNCSGPCAYLVPPHSVIHPVFFTFILDRYANQWPGWWLQYGTNWIFESYFTKENFSFLPPSLFGKNLDPKDRRLRSRQKWNSETTMQTRIIIFSVRSVLFCEWMYRKKVLGKREVCLLVWGICP